MGWSGYELLHVNIIRPLIVPVRPLGRERRPKCPMRIRLLIAGNKMRIMARNLVRECRRTGQYDDRDHKQLGYRFETHLH